MKTKEFIPNAWLILSTVCTLQICLVVENGETFVYSAFYDENGKKQSSVTKSRIRESLMGHHYFIRSKQRYYLNDFVKKPSS